MANRSMILLVHPPQHSDEKDFYDEEFAFCSSNEEYEARYNEFARLQQVLNSLGFTKIENHGLAVANLEGMNWEGTVFVDTFTISEQNIKLLEQRAEEIEQLRQNALNKLTTEEKVALGLLKQI